MSAEPVRDASAWTPDLLERDRSWEFFLSDEQQSTLARATAAGRRDALRADHGTGLSAAWTDRDPRWRTSAAP